jgi:hypothetical protein
VSSPLWPIFLKSAVKSGVRNIKYYLNYFKVGAPTNFSAAAQHGKRGNHFRTPTTTSEEHSD